MKVNSFIDPKKTPKQAAFRWRVVEAYRLGLASEHEILSQLKICRTCLRSWNRVYQHYRLRRYYPKPKRPKPMKKNRDEIALLKKQLAETQKLLQHERLKSEALETMINIAENELKLPIRKKSGSKQ